MWKGSSAGARERPDQKEASRSKAPGRVFKHLLDLLPCDAWEPLEVIVNPGPILEILKKGGHRDSGATKNPRATLNVWVLFNRRAS